MPQLELIEYFIHPLETAVLPYMVTGSVAAIFYGKPRMTHDVDIIIHLSPEDIGRFTALFPITGYYCPPAEVIGIEIGRKEFAHFNLIHRATGLKADCYPFRRDELETWAFSRRRRYTVEDSGDIWLAPPEYVILRKLQYYREGGSAKHLEDIKGLLSVSADTCDRVFLSSMTAKLDLQKYWALSQ
jgi:hypothetical protein